jgi:multicomponent Na+:H+ antiporter subunit D
VTTLYAVGYLEGSPNRRRFFGFFSLCVSSTMGVAMAGNLLTFFLFYEMLTLSTYPLVAHRGTPEARQAGAVYLRYTLTSGVVLLLAIGWLNALAGPQDFTERGTLAPFAANHRYELIVIFLLLILGFGVKAALVPLHGWLPLAMVAPAPVSALLHAVAVVKAGAFGIVRVVYDVYGVNVAHALGVTHVLAILAAVTIIWGSLRSLQQDDLKRRLAYSTVSQVSYIALGVAIAGPVATIGGIVHLVHQGLMKITLFFCAGNLAETLGIHKISEMDGVGRRMPWTLAAFTVGAFGMIGIPPVAGFISKWYLGAGALQAGQHWVIAVLIASTLLNAAYFLPILYRAWFRPAPAEWPVEAVGGRWETRWSLLLPPLFTALLALLAGLFAGAPFSPLFWASLIAAREYQ